MSLNYSLVMPTSLGVHVCNRKYVHSIGISLPGRAGLDGGKLYGTRYQRGLKSSDMRAVPKHCEVEPVSPDALAEGRSYLANR